MLKEAGFDVDLKTDITGEGLLKIAGDYDALVVRSRTKVTAEVLEAAGNLKVVARAGVGLDNVDLEEAKKRDVEVVNSPEAPSNAVAELVLGMMLSLARSIPEADASMKRGEWIKRRLTGFELAGKTLGIVGFGRIGTCWGRRRRPSGCGSSPSTSSSRSSWGTWRRPAPRPRPWRSSSRARTSSPCTYPSCPRRGT
jgi:D-3-phosphoglycerate dehydrogenase